MTRQMVLMDARVRRIDAGATDVVDATSADALVRGVVVREEGLGACAFVRAVVSFFRFVCVLCVWNSWLRMRLHRVVTTGGMRALVE
jgi:hypothetical protein